MKTSIPSILAIGALAISAFAQSPSPTPAPSASATPAPVPPAFHQPQAIVQVIEIVASGSVPAIVAAAPPTTTLPDGTIATEQGYFVRLSGTQSTIRFTYTR